MEFLLEKIGILNLKYEKLKDDHEFNIFSLLRKKGDEVNLHSNFIHEILNPEGSHRRGNEFLVYFLDIIGLKEFDVDEASLHKEKDKIDILIHNKNQAIIIENKIWANDQHGQLERYYKKIRKRGFSAIWIIYLTLHGEDPSKGSIGNLPEAFLKTNLVTASYSFEISKWIDECIAACARMPILRETLIQYNYLIEELTGKTMSNDQSKEVYELLAKNDNITKANTIAQNWIHIKWYLEWDFWTEFEQIIEKEYDILPVQKYSAENLNSAIHKVRNRNVYYGIMIELFTIKEDKFCLFIERGWEDIYYGIIILNGKERIASTPKKYKDFTTRLNEFTEWKQEEFWLGGNWLSPTINFETFSEENTLKLIDKDFRQAFLKKNWATIKSFIEKVKNLYHKP